MKSKIYNIILVILILLFVTTLTLIIIKYTKNHINENNVKEVVSDVRTQIEINSAKKDSEKKQVKAQYYGYNVVGIISIPKIGIEYPILDVTNEKSMKISITKFWGNNVNDIGNFTMAGHNNIDDTMFGATDKLKNGDKIQMTDLSGKTLTYSIYEIQTLLETDADYISKDRGNNIEIALSTCTDDGTGRLVILARAD